MSTEIGRLLRKYGLDFSAHGLRHSHFSILLSEGAPITAVQKRVGGIRTLPEIGDLQPRHSLGWQAAGTHVGRQ
jgi:hypothetical protein